jgi:CRISPR/Cas system Type II protein with McrA/HNH and RuvC-like nuclease domain
MAHQDSKRETLWREQEGRCLYCSTELKGWWSEHSCLDHIYPRSLGGSNENVNLALVCYPCNALKSDFTSLWQVLWHFAKMFKLFWGLLGVEKVQKALDDGKMKKYGREKIPNAIFKVGAPPIQAKQRSLRVEAYQRRVAAFQRFKRTSARSSVRSEAQPTSTQNR